jgi:hypothetical protein
MVYNSSATFVRIIPVLYWGQYIIGPLRCRRTCTTVLCYLWLESSSGYTHKRYQLRPGMLFILGLNGNSVPNVTFCLMSLQWVLGDCVCSPVFAIVSFSLTQNLGPEHCLHACYILTSSCCSAEIFTQLYLFSNNSMKVGICHLLMLVC